MADVFDRLKEALADRYAIEREIGSGGMATVYLAEDLKLHRKVALKVLKPDLAAALGLERFLQEIEIAAKLHHPHILPLHDSGDAGGFLYFVMPYEEGNSLREKLAREGELPIADAVRILRDVVDALSHAHKQNVVHRDIKPDNVMLSGRHALVTDFGVAKAVSAASGSQKLTTEGVALGTPAYMAPEQAAADPHIDHRADIYAIGAVAYELLTGRPPFTGNTQQEILAAHVTQAPDPVTKFRESVSPQLEQLVMKCLEKKAADRWQSAEELLPRLEAIATPSGGTTPTAMAPTSSNGGVRSGLWVAVAVIAVIVVGVAAIMIRGMGGSDARDMAVRPLEERPWVIVAEFEGGDRELAEQVRAVVTGALDQTELVVTVPSTQLSDALRAAGYDDTVRVTNQLARELAVRDYVQHVIQGRIDRIGETYSAQFRVIVADDGTVAQTASGTVSSDDELMQRLYTLVGELTPAFGEDALGARATERLGTIITPSFEAYKLAVEGRQLYTRGESRAARVPLKAALDLDPDFAVAWRWYGNTFFERGQRDSAAWAYGEAVARADRLPVWSRFDAEALLARSERDPATALRIYERAERQGYPLHHNHGLVLNSLRRYEEGAEKIRSSVEGSFAPNGTILDSYYWTLLRIGDIEEAKRVSRQLDSLGHVSAPYRAMNLAAADADWDALDSLGRSYRDDITMPYRFRRYGAYAVAYVHALRGRGKELFEQLGQIRDEELESDSVEMSLAAAYTSAIMSWMTEGTYQPVVAPRAAESTPLSRFRIGVHAATLGDTSTALNALGEFAEHPYVQAGYFGEMQQFLEAVLAANRRDWRLVADLLAAAADRGIDRGYLANGTPRTSRQWLVAEAYRQLDMPDSAAHFYENAAELKGSGAEILGRAYRYAYLNRRLAQMYGELGQRDRAAEHWNLFLEVFTDPDPELEYMVAEAHEALAELAREG